MNTPTYDIGIIQVKSHRVLQAYTSAALKKHGLNPGLWLTLGIVADAQDGIRLATVAKILHVKAPLVTSMANDLIAMGLLSRIPHQIDSRAKLLMLTTAGKQIVKVVEADLTASLNRLMVGVSAQQLQAYRQVMEAIIENGKDEL